MKRPALSGAATDGGDGPAAQRARLSNAQTSFSLNSAADQSYLDKEWPEREHVQSSSSRNVQAATASVSQQAQAQDKQDGNDYDDLPSPPRLRLPNSPPDFDQLVAEQEASDYEVSHQTVIDDNEQPGLMSPPSDDRLVLPIQYLHRANRGFAPDEEHDFMQNAYDPSLQPYHPTLAPFASGSRLAMPLNADNQRQEDDLC
ncbi:hypothetical protein ACM66B_003937 [Microbotryomycetes sp. NB124-2]